MSMVIVGAVATWFFFMGGKDFLWSIVKLIFGDGVTSLLPEEDQIKNDEVQKYPKERVEQGDGPNIIRRSEPMVRKPMLQIEGEDRVPMNAFLGKRIQPRI